MFGKKKKEADEEDTLEPEEPDEPEEPAPSGDNDASLGHILADVEKLKAQFSTFYELNKATTERFSRVNEQIGELRTMILDRDKSSRMLEAKATQAIDMVETVQPDKLMIGVRKQDAKIEALHANLESNEIILKNAMSELKDMRNKMQVFSGMEQVVKMSEEIKGELIEIRKTSSTITRHGDKVETIFTEMQKRFSGFEKYADNLKDIDKNIKDITSDSDSTKTRLTNFADKKDVEDLVLKFNTFQKQISGIIELANKKAENFEKEVKSNLNEKLEKVEKMEIGLQSLTEKTPELDKFFNILEKEAKLNPKEPEVENIKTPGKEEQPEEEEEEEKKKGLFAKLKEKLPKIGGSEEGEAPPEQPPEE